jgi:LysR family transcriptional regulator, glycine cleavage system transcriptional activator
MRSDLLMHVDRFPVCAPQLLSRGPQLKEPADLAHHVLLQDQSPCTPRLPDLVDWKRWLAAIGITTIDAERGPRFSFAHMALQAAAAGQGVALASSALIGDDLTTGRLVRPFGDLAVRSPYGYYLVCPEATAEREKVVMFRDWALAEAQAQTS